MTEKLVGHSLCGAITLTPKYDGALLPSSDPLTQVTYSSADSQFSIFSTNGDLIGETRPYSVTATFQSYKPTDFANVSTATASGIISFIDPCLNPFSLTPRVTANPAADNFSGNAIIVQVLEFQVSPSRCEVTYTCTDIKRKDGTTSNIDCSDITYDGKFDDVGNDGQLVISANGDDYESGKVTPGTYVIEITGSVNGSTGPTMDTTTIEITFADPCDPPVSISEPTLVNQKYILTNPNAASYNPEPIFTVDPPYCPYNYVWTNTNLEQVYPGAPVSAIQRNGEQFNFLYIFELPDMTQKQTVTATATTYSDYNNQNQAK